MFCNMYYEEMNNFSSSIISDTKYQLKNSRISSLIYWGTLYTKKRLSQKMTIFALLFKI